MKTRKWWMEHYLNMQGIVQEENIHQTETAQHSSIGNKPRSKCQSRQELLNPWRTHLHGTR
eukprot:3958402-Prorocentrum_lima.AAC.1